MKFKSTFLHPWIIISYFIAYQYSASIHQLTFEMFLVPELLGIILVSLLFVLINRHVKNPSTTAVLISLSIIVIFSYQQIYSVVPNLSQHQGGSTSSSRIYLWCSFLLGIFILLLIDLSTIFASKKIKWFNSMISRFLNILSLVLIITIVGILTIKLSSYNSINDFRKGWNDYLIKNTQVSRSNPEIPPDMYLIVLDGYGSSEVLNEIYDYDNSHFLDGLSDLGFNIIPEAKANYSQTRIVFTSMLNMNYFDEFINSEYKNSGDARPIIEMIRSNLVVHKLENAGYTTISFTSGYAYTEYLDVNEKIYSGFQFSDLERQILRTTIFYPPLHNSFYNIRRNSIMKTLTGLEDLSKFSSPKFVFAHIFCPHPPFIFRDNGEYVIPPVTYFEFDADDIISRTSSEYYYEGYRNQVEFISDQILITVQSILKNSETDPVIIIMGDHGPGLTVSQSDISSSNHYERMHILNALYLPGTDPASIPSDLTPVNTFRFIFNQYFGNSYELLENKSFVSPYNRPYDFLDVTELSNFNLAP